MTRGRAILLSGLIFSALFLWLAFRSIDPSELRAAIIRLNIWWSGPFLASLFCFCWMKAARWAVLLEPVGRTTTRQLFPAVVIGYAGTTLMPMQLGEIVRAYVASRELRSRVGPVVATIALERILDVFVLLSVLGLALTLGTTVGTALREAGIWLTAAGSLALLVLAGYALNPGYFVRLALLLLRPLPERLRLKVAEQLEAAAQGLQILRRPDRFLALILWSSLQWLFMLGCCWIALQALDLQIPHVAALLVLVTTLLGMSLPAGPGYIGTIQLAFWVALSAFGVSREDAAAASIFYHALLCVPLLVAGVAFLARMHLSVRQLRQATLAADSEISPNTEHRQQAG